MSARDAILQVLAEASAPMGSYHLSVVAGIRQHKRLRILGKRWEFESPVYASIPTGVLFPILEQLTDDGIVRQKTFASGRMSFELVRKGHKS